MPKMSQGNIFSFGSPIGAGLEDSTDWQGYLRKSCGQALWIVTSGRFSLVRFSFFAREIASNGRVYCSLRSLTFPEKRSPAVGSGKAFGAQFQIAAADSQDNLISELCDSQAD